MKLASIVLLIVSLFVAFFFLFGHMLNVAGREHQKRWEQWLAFSMEHHCVVSKPPTFWDGETTWECEAGVFGPGFQVVRRAE